MRTISITNQKGGCGKTTTALNLGACLAERGHQVVLVDLDPQGHATVGLNVPPTSITGSVWDLPETRLWPAGLLRPILPGLHLVPSGPGVEEGDGRLRESGWRQRALERFLDQLRAEKPNTEFVLLDTPPSVGPLGDAILAAAGEVLLTVEVSFFALHGVGRILSSIREIDRGRRTPTRVRAVATLYDRRTRFAREILKDLQTYFGDSLYDTVIRQCVRLREAASHGVPITVYSRRSSGFRDYMDLAVEIGREIVSESLDRSIALEPSHAVGSALR